MQIAIAVLLCATAVSTQAASPYSERVAGLLRPQLPGFQIKVVDDFTLQLRPPKGDGRQQWQLNLDRIASHCSAAPDDCDRVLADFVTSAVSIAQEKTFEPTTATLRAVLRPADYEAEIAKLVAPKGDAPVSRPFAGGLMAMCYFDAPTSMRPVMRSELAKLGLEPAHALDACVSATRAALPKVPTEPLRADGPGHAALGVLDGDSYMSSYLLLHDDWAELAGKLGGHLLVAAPDASALVYVQDTGPEMVKGVSAMTKDMYAKAERPISATVFRWTPTGWEIAAP
jgi:hypothetical protein